MTWDTLAESNRYEMVGDTHPTKYDQTTLLRIPPQPISFTKFFYIRRPYAIRPIDGIQTFFHILMK
jgi:hypothetical protein